MMEIYVPHPLRIQRKRTKGWRMPEGAVYVGRPGLFGNPFKSAKLFRVWLTRGVIPKCLHSEPFLVMELQMRRKWVRDRLESLRGKKLACWCGLDCECHADVLAELANK